MSHNHLPITLELPRSHGTNNDDIYYIDAYSCIIHTLSHSYCLTYGGRDKMGVIVQMAFLNSLSCENYYILISIYLKIVPISPIDNEPSLYQIMAGRRTGDKPISEPMMEYFTNAYMRISASWKTIASSCGRITIMATEGLAKQGT